MGWNPIEETKNEIEETIEDPVGNVKDALSSTAGSAQDEVIGPIADAIESGWESLDTQVFDPIASEFRSGMDALSRQYKSLEGSIEEEIGKPIENEINSLADSFQEEIGSPLEEALGMGKKQKEKMEDIGQNRAKIAREQWEDYKYRFRPKEKELMNIAMDQGMYANSDQEAIDTAMSEVGGSFDTSRGIEARRRSRYGITDAKSEASKRRSGLAETAAKVGAANTARAREDRRERGALTGGLSQAKKGMSV